MNTENTEKKHIVYVIEIAETPEHPALLSYIKLDIPTLRQAAVFVFAEQVIHRKMACAGYPSTAYTFKAVEPELTWYEQEPGFLNYFTGDIVCNKAYNYELIGWDSSVSFMYARAYENDKSKPVGIAKINRRHLLKVFRRGVALIGKYLITLPHGEGTESRVMSKFLIKTKISGVENLPFYAYAQPEIAERFIKDVTGLPFVPMQRITQKQGEDKDGLPLPPAVPCFLSWYFDLIEDPVPCRVTLIYRYTVNNNGKKNSQHRKTGWELHLEQIKP